MRSEKFFGRIGREKLPARWRGFYLPLKKDRKTRKEITRKGEDYINALKDTFNELLNACTEKIEKVKMMFPIMPIKKGKMEKLEKEAKTVVE